MRSLDNQTHLSADQQLCQLASILASGVLRLYKRGALPAGPSQPGPEIPPESGQKGLELSDETRLSVQRG